MNQQARLTFYATTFACAIFALPLSRAGTLIAHYEFEDPADLGHDSSGMDNHATTDSVGAVEGWAGGGAFFDESASSSFVKSGGLSGFTGKPGQTFAAWVKLDPRTTGYDGIISQDTGACCLNRVLLSPAHQPFINLSEHNDRNLTAAPVFAFDEWMHIAMTGEDIGGASEARVYVNGIEVAGSPQTFSLTLDASTWNTYLGAGEAGNAHRLTGTLDDVRIYEGTLTAEEIQDLLTPNVGSLQITRFVYDKDSDTFRFTWTSRETKSYSLFFSTSLTDFGSDIDDGIPSQGETTTFPPLDEPALANPSPGIERIFFRVEQNP